MSKSRESWAKVSPEILSFEKRFDEHTDLELVIAGVALMDVGLAEILSQRFAGDPEDIEKLLGLDGDGRAPGASLGARIQLARAVGVIRDEDVIVLRGLKNLRNDFAHKVKSSLEDHANAIEALLDAALNRTFIHNWSHPHFTKDEYRSATKRFNPSARSRVMYVLGAYHIRLSLMVAKTDRIANVWDRSGVP